MDQLMDKINLFFEEMEKRGMEVGAGQTAIVCSDGVVIVSTNEDQNVDIMIINNRVDMDYSLGITNKDVNQFKVAGEIMEEINHGE